MAVFFCLVKEPHYEFRCVGCGMAHTNTLKKIAHWYDDHSGECERNMLGFTLSAPIEREEQG